MTKKTTQEKTAFWEKAIEELRAEHAVVRQYYGETIADMELQLIELRARLDQSERTVKLITGGTPDQFTPVWVWKNDKSDIPF